MLPPGIYAVDDHDRACDVMPVVLVHGAPDRSKNFQAVLPLLKDLPVVVYDRRGYGKSLDAHPPARSFADHAADLIALLDGRRAIIVAQSVGCNVALTAAARAPDLVASMGLWEPPMAWADWWPGTELRDSVVGFAAASDTAALGEKFAKHILGEERWHLLSDRTRAMLRAEGAAFRTDMASELIAPFAFGDIHAPCVIGYGTSTNHGHEEGAKRLAGILGAEMFEVPGAGHFAPTERPEAFATLVRRAVRLAAACGARDRS
jgi:pimeloyl-ACP methyl ester carboxylesterase